MTKYIITETQVRNGEEITSYFSHTLEVPMFGTSPVMTTKKEEAKRFDSEIEAKKYAAIVGKKAIVKSDE